MQIVKKASHSMFVKANAATLAKNSVQTLHVLRVAGLAVGTKEGTTQYGPYVGLVGNFTCVNPQSGETVKAASLFLPDVAMAPLAAAVKMGQTPQFAFDVYLNLDEKSPVGVSYSIVDLAPQENDPVASLLAGAPALKALPAPVDEAPKAKAKTK